MQFRTPSRASATSVGQNGAAKTSPSLLNQRLNRASRSLNSQFFAGASRRMKFQLVAGASRRLNNQSVADSAAPTHLGINTHQWRRPQSVYGGKSAIGQQFAGRSRARHMPVRPRFAVPQQRCLTCRSTGAPTAGHQRPGRWYAVQFHRPGRCCPTVVARLPLRYASKSALVAHVNTARPSGLGSVVSNAGCMHHITHLSAVIAKYRACYESTHTHWRSDSSARRLYAPGSVRGPRRARTTYPRRITLRSTGRPSAAG